tara:strand:+ start:7423 stop:7800 length:378 start_codon:yes stop_codon:yes gene_type:complete
MLFNYLLLTSIEFDCKYEIHKTYDFYWDLPHSCLANMTLFDKKWSAEKVRFERHLIEKQCKPFHNRQMSFEEFDEILFVLQTFRNELVNAAQFCNCLYGMGNVNDLQSWWKQSIETKSMSENRRP